MSWSTLNNSHPLIANVIDQWQQLLNKDHPEKVYHEFLRKHANLFLVNGINSFFSIWKKFLHEPSVHGPHFISQSRKSLLTHWTPNMNLLSKFNEQQHS